MSAAKLQVDDVAAGAHGGAQRPARIDPSARCRLEPPLADLVQRDREVAQRLLGVRDLVRRHLGEVLGLQQLLAGDGEFGIDLHLRPGFLFHAILGRLKSLGDAGLAGLGLFRRAARRGDGRQDRQHLFDKPAALPVDAERLVEQHPVLTLAHEHRMQRPVEVLAVGNACDLDGAHRIDHGCRPRRHAGLPQRAGEMDDIVDDTAVRALVQGGHGSLPSRMVA